MKTSVNTVIVDRQGRFLLQMRDSNPGICHPLKWNFFGGKLEPGETPIVGAMREMAEEIGYSPKSSELEEIGVQADEVQRVHVVRLLTSIERHQVALGEGAGFGYFTLDDLTKIDITPMTGVIIQQHLVARSK